MKLWEKIFSIVVCFGSGTMWSALLWNVLSKTPTVNTSNTVGIGFLLIAALLSFGLGIKAIFEKMDDL